MINAVHIDDRDSCVTVTSAVKAGDNVEFRVGGTTQSVIAKSDVPVYHKVAVVSVKAGEFVYKYGERIGISKEDIEPGDYVHIHNLKPVGADGRDMK